MSQFSWVFSPAKNMKMEKMKNVPKIIYALFVANIILLCSIISLEHRKVNNNEFFTLTLPYQCDQDEYKTNNYNGDQVQLVRKAQVLQSCIKRDGHGIIKPMNPYFATKFFPSSIMLGKEKNIGWCRISQVGNKALTALFLNGKDVPVGLSVADEDSIKPREKMKFFQSREWKQYFKFLIVMHPFLRLVSAFRSRLEPQSG